MVVLHYPDPGRGASGIGRYSRELSRALAAAGEPVRMMPQRKLEVKIAGRGFGGLLSQKVQQAWRAPRGHGVLHSTHVYSAHRFADVATVQDCFPEVYREELGRTSIEERFWRSRLAHLLARQTRFITATASVRDTFLRLHPEIPRERMHVTPYGIDPKFRPPEEGNPRHPAFVAGAFNVLAVSDLNPRKRLDWLLEAILEMEGVNVVHAGTQKVDRPAWQVQAGRERRLETALGSRMRRLGSVGDDELLRLYQGADLFVIPSLDEGFGFPPLEALACGTPVLALDGPVFHEVLQDQAAYFRDVPDLAAALHSARGRGPVTAKEREKRHAWVRAGYTWSRTAELTIAAYRDAEAAQKGLT